MDNEKIFSPSGHLTQEAMFRYHSHGLSRDDQYAIEKHMAGCSLCAEAMDGTEKIRKENGIFTLSMNCAAPYAAECAASRIPLYSLILSWGRLYS
jgi:hypothetical protein